MKVKINGKEKVFDKKMSIIQACDMLDIEIPRFCYHEKLSIAGNCRICLVEVNGRVMPSCATDIFDSAEVYTDSEKVRAARGDVMKFILANHPLDCPICDQGGECDLQDQSYIYGRDSEILLPKRRAVANKDFGPLLSTSMNRCIHCTRCVRFSNEIAGITSLVAMQSGHHMEINNPYGPINTELSGNLSDVCPVGAITSTQYAHVARPWELKSFACIDVVDGVGSNIRVDVLNGKVVRILPRFNQDINQSWICDKARYSVDGLYVQRIDKPYIYNHEIESLQPTDMQTAINSAISILQKYDPSEVCAVIGSMVDYESAGMLKNVMKSIGSSHIECRSDNAYITKNDICMFNSKISGIDQTDAILIIGSNIRLEAPIIASRIRANISKRDLQVGYIGKGYDFHFEYDHIGETVNDIIDFDKSEFAQIFKSAKNPMIIIGNGVTIGTRQILDVIYSVFKKYDNLLNDNWNGYNYLHKSASIVGMLALGLAKNEGSMDFIKQKIKEGKIKAIYALGVDEFDFDISSVDIIYQGHHGSDVAMNAKVIIPGVAYTEKVATYINTEGRVQISEKASNAPGSSENDIDIFNDILIKINSSIAKPISKLHISEHFLSSINGNYDGFIEIHSQFDNLKNSVMPEITDALKNTILTSAIKDYYMTNIISSHSSYMARASKVFNKKPEMQKRYNK